MKMDLLTPESYDTKTLRENAQGLPQRGEGTQTQRKLSLKSDAFAAQNPAKQDSYLFRTNLSKTFFILCPVMTNYAGLPGYNGKLSGKYWEIMMTVRGSGEWN